MMKKKYFWIFLLALFSLASFREQVENIHFSSEEERMFRTLFPDQEWNQPLYLYSANGLPYRCYLRASSGLPIICRRTEIGEETLEAEKRLALQHKK